MRVEALATPRTRRSRYAGRTEPSPANCTIIGPDDRRDLPTFMYGRGDWSAVPGEGSSRPDPRGPHANGCGERRASPARNVRVLKLMTSIAIRPNSLATTVPLRLARTRPPRNQSPRAASASQSTRIRLIPRGYQSWPLVAVRCPETPDS